MSRSSSYPNRKAPGKHGLGRQPITWRLVAILVAALSLTGLLTWSLSAAPMVSVLQSPIDTPSVTPTATVTATASTTPTPNLTSTPTPTPTATPARWVSGTIYLDANRNQVKENDEQGISGVRVYLRMTSGPTIETQTDARGRFQFVNMSPGHWWLGIQVPAGMELTSIAANPLLVIIGNYALLDIPFGLAFLPGITPTPTPAAPMSPQGWLPLIACQRSVIAWLPMVAVSQ